MARYILALSIESSFYREFHEAGHSNEELMEQLRGDIKDQIAEYPLSQLISRMLSLEGKLDIPIFVAQGQQEFGFA